MTKASAAPKPADLPIPAMPAETFPCIAIDPPWHFNTRAEVSDPTAQRSPQHHYPTMTIESIAAIPVGSIAAKDSYLFLWITLPLMLEGVHVRLLEAWGFSPTSSFVWVKTGKRFDMQIWDVTGYALESDFHMGMGYTTRQNAEIVVIGRRGRPQRLAADVRQLIFAPVRDHSRKPEEFYSAAERLCAGPRIDMFGGADRPGWTHWGHKHRPEDRVP